MVVDVVVVDVLVVVVLVVVVVVALEVVVLVEVEVVEVVVDVSGIHSAEADLKEVRCKKEVTNGNNNHSNVGKLFQPHRSSNLYSRYPSHTHDVSFFYQLDA